SEHGGGVVEGRDIGSVVFPQADLKVYLTAHPTERARRRDGQRGDAYSLPAGTMAELERRDLLDSSRRASPLEVAEGAIVVDSTSLSVEEVVEEVLSHL
ncbi:MAG: (d)CMP kinase, partial [Acidimicrobiales bacterium]